MEVRFSFQSRREAQTIFEALKPEVQAASSFKTKVSMNLKGKTLVLLFKAPTLSSLRASVNSFCRWVSQLQRVLELARSA